MNTSKFQNVFKYKVIYVFSIDDNAHKGMVKIGDATLNTSTPIDLLSPNSDQLNEVANQRIKSYTNTAGISYTLLHTELATRTIIEKDGTTTLKAFRDHDVHAVLENSNIKKEKVGNTTGKEWFKIDLNTAKKAIEAVKLNHANLSNTNVKEHFQIIFRPEQLECIEKVVEHFKKSNRFLINAKMRYGKTFVSLEIVKRSKFQKTIIITHRPVVNSGWYEDFTKIFAGTDYVYGSKVNGNTVKDLVKKNKSFIYFASMQDLRESKYVGGQYPKNEDIFKTEWDCVIVDEAHEGTQTALGDKTISAVVKPDSDKTKFLALSGTPFNILEDYDDNSLYTWDYIMEQEAKYEWDNNHFGDSNPYEELPKMEIYTYDLGEVLKTKFIAIEDKAFNFREFFRTWTGDFELDYEDMPPSAKIGDFVHEEDVKRFLDLLTKNDKDSNYPFSQEEYRKLFHHTLWMVPGVKEAKALKALMQKHKVFSFFNIVNVAGSDDEESKDALPSVRNAIKNAGEDGYTITLSCGKLTTGVTVKEWTGIFMLSGAYSSSAANYLQTIFRVQSPCNNNGKIKDVAYVFDFAPDRTLKMVADAVSISTKVGKSKLTDKSIMGKFLNYCSVISISGSTMKEYNAGALLQQLKRAYAERVVNNGFDDKRLYNDELLKLNDVDWEEFKNLDKIIKGNAPVQFTRDIKLNNQGLTDEEHEELEGLEKKKKQRKILTEEEKARDKKIKEEKDRRKKALDNLRAMSVRMPLLIYGADVSYDEDISLDKFFDLVDEKSWEEFMPRGLTKDMFKYFKKYYDEDVFIGAGRRIRDMAKEADSYEPTERVMKIAPLYRWFKNPDKETVLTPWSAVNLHMSTTIGGWDFLDKNHKKELEYPRYVEVDGVTKNIFNKKNPIILEINSKTGLYPLYMAYSVYREKLEHKHLDFEGKKKLWFDVIKNNIFVVCNTPMAMAITKRALVGFSGEKVNAVYYDDFIGTMENNPKEFINRVRDKRYWKKDFDMKFDAIVGNPPYMLMDGGAKASAKPIYHYFVQAAKLINPKYFSFIIPARWYAGGKGLDNFRDEMLNDAHIKILNDCLTPEDIFPNTNIRGGICWFLWEKEYNNKDNLVKVISREHNVIVNDVQRPMKTPNSQFFIRDYDAISILQKVRKNTSSYISQYTSVRKPFGLDGDIYKSKKFSDTDTKLKNPVKCYIKNGQFGYLEKDSITKNIDLINIYKVYTSYANNIGTELNDDNLNSFVGEPNTVCSETYIFIGEGLSLDEEQCINITKYLKTKTVRYLHSLSKASHHGTAKTYQYVPLQNFTNNSDINWSVSIDDIDKQLFKKYGFTETEYEHIGKRIKPMDE